MEKVLPNQSELADLHKYKVLNGSVLFNEYVTYRSQDQGHHEALKLVVEQLNSLDPATRKLLTDIGGMLTP